MSFVFEMLRRAVGSVVRASVRIAAPPRAPLRPPLRCTATAPPPSTSHVGLIASLRAHARKGDLIAIDAQLRNHDHMQPLHPRLWEVLIDACAKQGDAARATAYFERMMKEGATPDGHTYATMVQLHARRGAADEAAAYWDEMLLRNLQPEPTALAALISVLGRRGRADEAERYYAIANEKGARASAVVQYALMSAFGRSGALEKMEQVHSQLTRMGFEASSSAAFSALITGYCASGALQSAIQVYASAVAQGARLEGAALSSLVRLAVRRGEAAGAYAAGLRPSLDTFAVLLQHCLKECKVDLADALFASLPQWRLRANRVLYTTMLECQAHSGRAVRTDLVSAQMLKEGFELDARCLSALAEAHAVDGNLVRAASHLQELRRMNVAASKAAIEAFARTATALNDAPRLAWLSAYQSHTRSPPPSQSTQRPL